MTAAICATCMALPASAQMVRQADIDYEASGFVTPAGMVHPSMYQGGVAQVGYGMASDGMASGGMYGQEMPYIEPMSYGEAGMYGGYCDSGSCDSPGGCDGTCGGGGGGCCGFGSCCGLFEGGLLGKMSANDGMCGLRHICLFCRGDGCSACQGLSGCASLVKCLLPYSEAGLCAERWYDVSLEAVFLEHSNSGQSGVLTTDGVAGTPVLNLSDADIGSDLEAGIRISGSLIFGVASNMELTYMGGNEWSNQAVGLPNPVGNPTLYSFISEFGTNPQDTGFDDTDRSLVQALSTTSAFHSAEWNYRRRSMGPYCRFQGSWLVGLRYVRFDNRLIYACRGENDNTVNANLPRFFSSDDKVKNNLFGPQAGFDLWWNVVPGVNLGMGLKGAWVQNDAKRQMILTGNSLDPLATPGSIALRDTSREGTVLGEFEATLIYRLSHSWSFRSSYYAIGVDDVAYGTVDGQVARDFVTVNPVNDPIFYRDSLVVQGLSFGTEYMW